MSRETFVLVIEGVWASITGGCYYDKKQSDFSNLFHLYIWLFFLCLPFVNYLFLNNFLGWSIYVGAIGVIFVVIKLTNLYLHRLFDSATCVEEEPIVSDLGTAQNAKSPTEGDGNTFEMKLLDGPWFRRVAISENSTREQTNSELNNNSIQKRVDCQVDVHFNDNTSSIIDLSRLFREETASVDGVELDLSRSPQSLNEPKGSLDSVSSSVTSLSNITTVNTKPKSIQSVSVIESVPQELSTFRRARSELEPKGSSKPIFNPPSHPVSLETINAQPKAPNTLQSSQYRARENVSELDSSVTFLEEKSQSETDAKNDGREKTDESQDKSKPTSFFGVYLKDFDSSDDGDESEISLCLREPSKSKAPIVRKSKGTTARKVRYGPANRKRQSKAPVIRSNLKAASLRSNSSKNSRKPGTALDFLVPSDSDEGLVDDVLFSHSSETISSGSGRDSSLVPMPVSEVRRRFDYIGTSSRNPNFRQPFIIDPSMQPLKISLGELTKRMHPGDMERRVPQSTNPLEMIASTSRTHLATSHEDTSVGSIHVFQDEKGNWFTYTFDDNSTGQAKGLNPSKPETSKSDLIVPSNSVHLDMSPSEFALMTQPSTSTGAGTSSLRINRPDTPISSHASHMFRDRFTCQESLNVILKNMGTQDSTPAFIETPGTQDYMYTFNMGAYGQVSSKRDMPKKNFYYEVDILNFKKRRINFDRLALLAFLDRNLSLFELISSIVLAICVSIFASIIISQNFFQDLYLVVFCLVVASSQYTLLKSVQPDAASPTHGFNRVTIYSRPIYFCLLSAVMLGSHEYVTNYEKFHISFEIYGLNLFDRSLVESIFVFSKTIFLVFPVLFVFGFLPQINTFVMFLLEQVDIHIFGGTAATIGLYSATYSVFRSFLTLGFLTFWGHVLAIDHDRGAKFSVFCGMTVSLSYHLSRLPTDPSLYWNIVKSLDLMLECARRKFGLMPRVRNERDTRRQSMDSGGSFKSHTLYTLTDPLPQKLKNIKNIRFESDLVTCIFIGILVFGAHVSSIFKLQPIVNNFLTCLVLFWGVLLHYVLIKFRKQLPWLFFSHPILKSNEYQQWDVTSAARIMLFERFQAWLWLIEKNIVLPLFFLGYLTVDCPLLIDQYGSFLGIVFVAICSLKAFRSGYNDPASHYLIILFTHLLFIYDFKVLNSGRNNIFLVNFFFVSILYHKVYDLLLKLRFVVSYVAPWQITWGSAFHAFAQPFSVPHSAMLLVQILISALLSSPLQPLMGSAIFLASYVRPIKFWERDYNTKRVDHSNTRLASQIDNASIGNDDNNLNSIFYEHLTRSLQHSLYGDIVLGRWGDVSQGDCFVLAGYSDNLNCLVHIIELGNGMVTFQLRGLEFRGTYCQQREVEAITETVSDDEGCCCCEPGHFRGILSVNAAFNQRWLSWEVTQPNYILEGYSISVNSANTILQPYDFRKSLITNYVKSIIYFCIAYKNFRSWLVNDELRKAIAYLNDPYFVDLDPTFNHNIDEDFDFFHAGITRTRFRALYFNWIRYCVERKLPYSDAIHVFARENIEQVVTLCFGLSLLARRAIGIAAQNFSASMNVEFFLYGLHALFKGDFRVHCSRDEWVFHDMAFIDQVIAPSVRMSLKLHQDQFTTFEDYVDDQTMYDAISEISQTIVISHEADPIWRNAILSNVPSLLALRHVYDEGSDQYKVIMLNKRFLNFRIIKINRECVRGLWAGQQQELIFLRNSNPERGSIQNAKQALRNIINSSCDQPIGYPIYVSPLTTSFAETSDILPKVIGPPVTLSIFKRAISNFIQKIQNRCREVCSGSGSGGAAEFQVSYRVSKSESSDRGLDDSISYGNKTISSQVSKFPMKNLVSAKHAIPPQQPPPPPSSLPTPASVASASQPAQPSSVSSASAAVASSTASAPVPLGSISELPVAAAGSLPVQSSTSNIETPTAG